MQRSTYISAHLWTKACRSLELLASIMGRQPHVLVIPSPAQGHVAPLMKLSHLIADHGIKVTFVNTEFIHAQIRASMQDKDEEQSLIRLVSIPDGLEPGDERKDGLKLSDSILRVMRGHLEDLIEKIKRSDDDEQITCVIADLSNQWALQVAKKMEIEHVAVSTIGPGSLALLLHIPKLIEDGIIDTEGNPLKNELIWLSKDIPAFSSNEFTWSCPGNSKTQKVLFGFSSKASQNVKLSKWLLCNTFYELDSSACDLIPNILPIGPLFASKNLQHSTANFWREDSTCISWLNKQPAGSVIYVAFGSITIFSQQQFDEIALGLEIIKRPFLLVVRANLTHGSLAKYPEGFTERVASYGKIVEWAPQEKVLAHPSIACFLTHCGWNSTMEGLSNGVPFLCWPHFADQFHNKSYICDIWKIGLGMTPDENGIISRHQIKTKMDMLLSDDGIKANALRLKEMAKRSVSEGGSSAMNFESLIGRMKC